VQRQTGHETPSSQSRRQPAGRRHQLGVITSITAANVQASTLPVHIGNRVAFRFGMGFEDFAWLRCHWDCVVVDERPDRTSITAVAKAAA